MSFELIDRMAFIKQQAVRIGSTEISTQSIPIFEKKKRNVL